MKLSILEINIPVYCVDMIGDSWAVAKKDLKIVEDRILKKEILIIMKKVFITDYIKNPDIEKKILGKVKVIALKQKNESLS